MTNRSFIVLYLRASNRSQVRTIKVLSVSCTLSISFKLVKWVKTHKNCHAQTSVCYFLRIWKRTFWGDQQRNQWRLWKTTFQSSKGMKNLSIYFNCFMCLCVLCFCLDNGSIHVKLKIICCRLIVLKINHETRKKFKMTPKLFKK